MGLKRQGLVAPADVQPRHVKLNSGADSGGPLRRSRPRRLTSLEFQSNSISEGVALGLPHLHQYVLLRIGSFRVLHRRIDLAEDAQIIEPSLRSEEIPLAQRFTFVHLQFSIHNVVARMFRSGDQDAIHGEALPFLNSERYVFSMRLIGGLFAVLPGRVRKSMI